jgi:hypothetical protein
MDAARLAAIISDALSRGGRRRMTHDLFRGAAERNWKQAAADEALEYFTTVHGKRAPKAERDRIEREILREHGDRWRVEVERLLTLDGHSHAEEVPALEAYARECSQPPTAAEAYEAAVSDRGSADRPLMLALLEQITRNGIRRELSGIGPAAALDFYRGAINGNGVTPDAVVRRAVLIQEIERRSTWEYDPKGEHAAAEHAASLELQRLVAATKASRVPVEVREALAQASEARRYASRMRQIHKLQVRPIDEVLSE